MAGKGPAQGLFLCSFLSPCASGRAEQTKSYISAELWGRSTLPKGALQWLRLMSGSPGCETQLAVSCLTGWFCLLAYEAERAVHPPLPLPFLYFPTGEVTGRKKKRRKRKYWEGGRWTNASFHFLFIKLEGIHWIWLKRSSKYWLYFLYPA